MRYSLVLVSEYLRVECWKRNPGLAVIHFLYIKVDMIAYCIVLYIHRHAYQLWLENAFFRLIVLGIATLEMNLSEKVSE